MLVLLVLVLSAVAARLSDCLSDCLSDSGDADLAAALLVMLKSVPHIS